ncbi:MAG: LPS-assembly protein LptD [Lentisphaerae bacterium]|nr:LPS-assembly protein LptD [Lentisphaerota bacterium]
MRKCLSLGLGAVLGAGCFHPAFAQQVPTNRLDEAVTHTSEQPLDVKADNLELERDKNLAILSGNVTVRRGLESIRADTAIVNDKILDVIAEGNVTFERGSELWTGRKAHYNFKTHKGDFWDCAAFMDPFYVKAKSSHQLDKETHVLRNARLTTCEDEPARAYMRARKVVIVPGHHIRAWNVVLFVNNAPVMYMPYWSQNIGDPNFLSVVPGYNRRMSGFLLMALNYRLSPHLEAATHVDYRMRRGLGGGQDLLWSSSGNSKGPSSEMFADQSREEWYFGKGFSGTSAKAETEDEWFGDIVTYFMNDRWPDEGRTQTYDIDADRGRARFYHNQTLDDNNYLLSQANILSDPEIIHQFFRDEYKAQPEPENYLILGHRGRDYALSLQFQKRLNDFFTAVDRFPELTLDLSRQQIGASPFFYEGRHAAGFLAKNWETAETNETDYSAFRFDTENIVFYPTKHFGFLSVIPRAAYRGTYYSRTKSDYSVTNIVSETDSNGVVTAVTTNVLDRFRELDADYRSMVELGLETSFKSFKVWETYPGDVINDLRHIAEPYVDYTYIPEPNLRPADVFQFDDIDARDQEHSLKLGFRNKLQTKRAKLVTDIVNADLWVKYYIVEQEDGRDFGNPTFIIRSDPLAWLSLRIDGQYDPYDALLDEFNTRAAVTQPRVEYALEHRYANEDSNQLEGSISVAPTVRTRFRVFGRNEFEGDDGTYEYGFSVERSVDCLTSLVGVEWQDEDFEVFLQFWFTQFPKGRVGVGL